MVECNLPKVEVAGSSPVSRSARMTGAAVPLDAANSLAYAA